MFFELVSMKEKPLISVIMPVYNTANYLKEAIDSILNQSFTNFEFIIIEDASTDNSLEIIKSYKDDRIVLIENKTNQGYVYGLNLGIEIARGKYIARMDSDDISCLNRFLLQIKFIEANSDIVLLGTAIKLIKSKQICEVLENNDDIKIDLLMGCSFNHPSVLINRSFLLKNKLRYDPYYYPAEDYALWVQITLLGGKLANINSPLLLYREHENQTSFKYNKLQKDKSVAIRLMLYQKLDAFFNFDKLHFQTDNYSLNLLLKLYFEKKEYLNTLRKYNSEKKIFNKHKFKIHCYKQLLSYQILVLSRPEFNKWDGGLVFFRNLQFAIFGVGIIRSLKIAIRMLYLNLWK